MRIFLQRSLGELAKLKDNLCETIDRIIFTGVSSNYLVEKNIHKKTDDGRTKQYKKIFPYLSTAG